MFQFYAHNSGTATAGPHSVLFRDTKEASEYVAGQYWPATIRRIGVSDERDARILENFEHFERYPVGAVFSVVYRKGGQMEGDYIKIDRERVQCRTDGRQWPVWETSVLAGCCRLEGGMRAYVCGGVDH